MLKKPVLVSWKGHIVNVEYIFWARLWHIDRPTDRANRSICCFVPNNFCCSILSQRNNTLINSAAQQSTFFTNTNINYFLPQFLRHKNAQKTCLWPNTLGSLSVRILSMSMTLKNWQRNPISAALFQTIDCASEFLNNWLYCSILSKRNNTLINSAAAQSAFF
jgi:hypothetical protein